METEYLEPIQTKLEAWYTLFIENIPNLVVAFAVMAIAYGLSRLVFKGSLRLISKRVKSPAVSRLLARTAAVVVVLGGLFLALSAMNLGKSLNSLLAGAGISGLVIGLALQSTLANTFAGIVLSFRKNVRIGHWIASNGYEGEVMDITLNYLVLKEADNNLVVIPNKQILDNPFKNNSLTELMRVTVECGVGYDSDLERVEEITTKIITDLYDQEALDKTFEFYYTGFGDSAISFICRFWVSGQDGRAKLIAKSRAIMAIQKAFAKEGIDIPFPIRTINWPKEQPVTIHANGMATKQNA